MAKGNAGSAAQRRKQQQYAARQNKQNKRRKIQRQKKSRAWFIFGGIIVAVIAIIGIFAFIANQNKPVTNSDKTLPATTLDAVTKVKPALLAQIGNGGIPDSLMASQGSPALLTGPSGKPEVLYVGAEYCPYCATERWSLVAALSRFGTFHNLSASASSATDVYPNTPTFTFYGSSYDSSYIDFVSVETSDQQQNPLQSLTSDQQNLMNTYDAPPYVTATQAGGIPFTDIGNRYINDGAVYDPGVLRTNPKDPYSAPQTQQYIAAQLTSNNVLSKQVFGATNYLTAAICSITGDQPANVCKDSAISQIEASLPQAKAQSNVNGTQASTVPGGIAELLPLSVRRRS